MVIRVGADPGSCPYPPSHCFSEDRKNLHSPPEMLPPVTCLTCLFTQKMPLAPPTMERKDPPLPSHRPSRAGTPPPLPPLSPPPTPSLQNGTSPSSPHRPSRVGTPLFLLLPHRPCRMGPPLLPSPTLESRDLPPSSSHGPMSRPNTMPSCPPKLHPTLTSNTPPDIPPDSISSQTTTVTLDSRSKDKYSIPQTPLQRGPRSNNLLLPITIPARGACLGPGRPGRPRPPG